MPWWGLGLLVWALAAGGVSVAWWRWHRTQHDWDEQ